MEKIWTPPKLPPILFEQVKKWRDRTDPTKEDEVYRREYNGQYPIGKRKRRLRQLLAQDCLALIICATQTQYSPPTPSQWLTVDDAQCTMCARPVDDAKYARDRILSIE